MPLKKTRSYYVGPYRAEGDLNPMSRAFGTLTKCLTSP